MQIHPAQNRFHSRHGWLDSRHTFSFADHYDPKRIGFRTLRVINDDRVDADEGFGTHPHRDMEILTWVLEGALAHRDSMGTQGVIRPGDMQRMSAGTGVTHSEMNASRDEPVHFLQIWITPKARGLTPSYEQKHFAEAERRGKLRLLASPDGRDGSITVHQDVSLYTTLLSAGEKVSHSLAQGRHAFVHVARGQVKLGDQKLGEGDGVQLSEGGELRFEGVEDAEVLLFDLA